MVVALGERVKNNAEQSKSSAVLEDDYIDEEYGREFTEEELIELFEAANQEEEEPPSFFRSPRFRKIVAVVIALMLCAQLVVFIPQIFSLPAIQFLKVSAQLSKLDSIQQYKQSVVVINSEDSKGTGFIVSEDGHIVTNRHVVDGAKTLTVRLANGERYIAKVLSVDEDVDLALIDIEAAGLPVLPLAESYDGTEGVPVYIIGNPLFFNGIANEGETWGLLSDRSKPVMALQAPVYKGNSGSPVINRDGEVIGVVYATSTARIDGKKHRIGLAVPVDWVWEHLR